MSKINHLLLLLAMAGIPSPSIAQSNLNFEKGKIGGSPEDWHPIVGDSLDVRRYFDRLVDLDDRVKIRSRGCRNKGRCIYSTEGIWQVFPAAKYRGGCVKLDGRLRPSHGSRPKLALKLYYLDPNLEAEFGPIAVSADAVDSGWITQEIVAYIPSNATRIMIAVKDVGKEGSWVDDLAFTTVDADSRNISTDIPQQIRRQYARIDTDVANLDFGDIATITISTQPENQGRQPFLSRAGGLSRFAVNGSKVATRTVVESLEVLPGGHALVRAHTTIERTSKSATYKYQATNTDLWSRSGEAWKLYDMPPDTIADISDSHRSTDRPREANDRVPCGFVPSTSINVGPSTATTYRRSVRPRGTLSALMVFIDFEDGRGDEDVHALFSTLSSAASEWFGHNAGGIVTISFSGAFQWYHIPGKSAAYTWSRFGGDSGSWRLEAAVVQAAAGDELHWADYDLIYVVSAKNPNLDGRNELVSGAVSHAAGKGVPVGDGNFLPPVVFYGRPVSRLTDEELAAPTGSGAALMIHETLHLFGLPDLYQIPGAQNPSQAAGAWDVMSDLRAKRLTAWSRVQLGWLADGEITCLTDRSTTATLSPVSAPSGVKAIMVPLNSGLGYVIESREITGSDLSICSEGVLVYRIDPYAKRTYGPIMQVEHVNKDSQAESAERCGPAYDQILNLTADQRSMYQNDEISVKVLRAELGAYTVEVARK